MIETALRIGASGLRSSCAEHREERRDALAFVLQLAQRGGAR